MTNHKLGLNFLSVYTVLNCNLSHLLSTNRIALACFALLSWTWYKQNGTAGFSIWIFYWWVIMMSDDHRLGWNHVNRGALEQKRNEVACTRLPWQSLGNKLNIHIITVYTPIIVPLSSDISHRWEYPIGRAVFWECNILAWSRRCFCSDAETMPKSCKSLKKWDYNPYQIRWLKIRVRTRLESILKIMIRGRFHWILTVGTSKQYFPRSYIHFVVIVPDSDPIRYPPTIRPKRMY